MLHAAPLEKSFVNMYWYIYAEKAWMSNIDVKENKIVENKLTIDEGIHSILLLVFDSAKQQKRFFL